MPGPKPLPNKLKELKGTLRKCRTNPDSPEIKVSTPIVPDYLNETAKAMYIDLAQQFTEMQIISQIDRYALELLCESMLPIELVRTSYKLMDIPMIPLIRQGKLSEKYVCVR
jgi:phage terminase small subunit